MLQEPEIEPVMVTLRFAATEPDALLAVLSKYVVLARNEPGCRNIDLVASVTHPHRFLLIEKWDSATAQQNHFDGSAMVEMAKACTGLLSDAPDLDLFEGVSMHDLA